MKTGIIDVGGGFRGIYGAGVFDALMDAGVTFDYCIGVSAGSANIASYLAKQRGRNFLFYSDYVFRKDYISFNNLITKKNYLDLDYVYGTLANTGGDYPLDYQTLSQSSARFTIVTCNALTGKTVYLDKSDLSQDHYDAFKASSCLPVACEPYFIHGIPYYDGGLADPVPVAKAFADGCDCVVLVLTKPAATIRDPKTDRIPARLLRHTYPLAAMRLEKRAATYNAGIRLAKRYAKQKKLLIVAPDTCYKLKSPVDRDKKSLELLYKEGYRDAQAIPGFLDWKQRTAKTA
ncbi:MAG: patatin family protein [Eubacteriaceae bacterium]|jgi:predicted patatin/cPLA2 family phospholipase|nr:patatin family protein [Eubacteriaceae bacterium]MDD4507794.1 patatin family protein [Eubacteriaceae bacterium]